MEIMQIDEEDVYAIFLGDDALVFTYEEEAAKFKSYYSGNPFGLNYKNGEGCGSEPLFSGATQNATFCSMLLMPVVIEGVSTFALGMDPRRLFAKTFWRSADILGEMTVNEKVYHCRTVAKGLLGAVWHVDGVYDVVKALSEIPTTKIAAKRASVIRDRIALDNEYSILGVMRQMYCATHRRTTTTFWLCSPAYGFWRGISTSLSLLSNATGTLISLSWTRIGCSTRPGECR